MQEERELRHLEPADRRAELGLEVTQQRLDVDRQSVERAAIGREAEVVRADRAGDLRGPRHVGVEHGAARDAVGQRVADHDQAAGGRRWHGHRRRAERDAERRVGQSRRRDVGDDDVVGRVRIQVLLRQRAGHASSPSSAGTSCADPRTFRATAGEDLIQVDDRRRPRCTRRHLAVLLHSCDPTMTAWGRFGDAAQGDLGHRLGPGAHGMVHRGADAPRPAVVAVAAVDRHGDADGDAHSAPPREPVRPRGARARRA